jgi:hypothetical protein
MLLAAGALAIMVIRGISERQELKRARFLAGQIAWLPAPVRAASGGPEPGILGKVELRLHA